MTRAIPATSKAPPAAEQARQLIAGGAVGPACTLLLEHLQRHPRDLQGHMLLSYAALLAGRRQTAAAAARSAQGLCPALPRARCSVALCLARAGLQDEARQLLDGLEPQDCGDADVAAQLAQTYEQLKEYALALTATERAVQLAPRDPRHRIDLAVRLERAQRIDEARAQAEVARAQQPDQPRALRVLMRIDHHSGRLEAARTAARELLAQPLSDAIRRSTLMELSRIAARLDAPQEAFEAAQQGNALSLKEWAARPQSDLDAFPRLLQSVREFQQGPGAGQGWSLVDEGPQQDPVFVVGFPRSGTTLMQAIAEAHPQLTTLEEEPLLDEALTQALGARPYAQVLQGLSADGAQAIRRAYFERLRLRVPDQGRRVVDKLPLNLARVDLIVRVFPGAKLLVMLRDPRAAVLSAFLQDFVPSESMVQCADLERCARMYAACIDIWRCAKSLYGSMSYHELRYEDLVGHPRPQLERVLDFLDLPWDDAVVDHRRRGHGATTNTPSYRDVRSPLYARSLKRYEQFLPQLEPVLEMLAPYVKALGYD